MKIKTSTRISLIFSIFTFFIILVLLLTLNIYLFFSWYNKEIVELKESHSLTDIISESYREILQDELGEEGENELLEDILSWNLFDIKQEDRSKYYHMFLDLYTRNDNIYLLYQKKSGGFYAPYDVTEYYTEQLKMVKLGFILLCIFTLLSFVLSKFLFIKLALRDIHFITQRLKKIHLHNVERINIPLHKDDEIHTIVEGINHFLEVIEKNTKNLEAFNAQVAHEFKTPLMVISSELEYLELKGQKNESSKRVAYQIGKLDSLLEHFLLLTKIQNGKKLKKNKVCLKELIQENLSPLEKKYQEKKVSYALNIEEDYTLHTNKDFFHIVIKNILDNAFKYNRQGGEINITLENNILKILDTGVGIDKNNINKIWNNLYRENELQEGYGVGLNLVKKIIELLDYHVEVSSNKGKGTQFSIYFK